MPTHKDLPLDVEFEEVDPSNPKPDTSTGTKTEPKPTATDTPKPDTKPAADTKRFNPKVGKFMTQMGVPPSAVRNLTTGKPVAGVKGLVKGQWNAGQHWSKVAGSKLSKLAPPGTKLMTKGLLRAVPVLGSAVAAYAAFKNFKSGDYIGGVLNLVSVIPGPIGWIGVGASLIWEATGWGDRYDEWAKPDGENTYMLQAEAKDVANVKEIDAALRTAQNSVFAFQDGPTGSVWDSSPPAPLELSTTEVKAAAETWLNGITKLFADIDKAMLQSGEQYFTEQRQKLTPHLTAMAALGTQVKSLTDQLDAADKGAAVAYKAVTNANKSARGQLASSGKLDDAGPATTMKTEMEKGQAQLVAANSKIDQLWAETPAAVVLTTDGTPTATKPGPAKTETPKPATPTPAAVTPTTQTPSTTQPAKTETPNKNTDDISKLLSQLGNQAKTATPTSNPLGTGTGGGSPLGTGTGGGNQGGGTPLSSSKPDTAAKDESGKKLVDDKKTTDKKPERKLADDKSLSGAKPEQAKAAVPAEQKPAAAVPAPGAPAATVPGTGAPTPAQQNAAAAAAQAEPNKEVDVKGQKTTFPDAKTAKMADILAKADPTHPVSLADAAKAAGLTPPVPGQDPGAQINPAQAKPGDIMVAGDKQYMLLGDGKFYDLTDYKIVGAADLPQNMGDRAGYFHLNDPNPGAQPGAPAASAPVQPQGPGPVSGQTGGVQNAVPNATGAPQGPVAGSAPDAQPPVDGSQGGGQGSQPGAPAAPGGVPSVGAPGVPKPGAPGAGPANAAGTATGTGQGGPSVGGGSLDPGAIK